MHARVRIRGGQVRDRFTIRRAQDYTSSRKVLSSSSTAAIRSVVFFLGAFFLAVLAVLDLAPFLASFLPPFLTETRVPFLIQAGTFIVFFFAAGAFT